MPTIGHDNKLTSSFYMWSLDSLGVMHLPVEILIDIMKSVDWYGLMALRKTCKKLFWISKDLAIWRSHVCRYINQRNNTIRLEMPLQLYSASQLEKWLTQKISADAGWSSPNEKPTRFRKIEQRSTKASHLLPGGRWLLVVGSDASIISYDLDAPMLEGRELLKLPDPQEILYLSTDVKDSPYFAFNLTLSQYSINCIRVWEVTLVGHGNTPYLQAKNIRTFNADTTGFDTLDISLCGHLFGRIVAKGDWCIEVFDWSKSSSSIHCKSTVVTGVVDYIRLLPKDRLLVVTNDFIRIYSVVPIDGQKPLPSDTSTDFNEAIWSLQCHVHRICQGGISPTFSNQTSTQLVFIEDMNICGLVIPHDPRIFPRYLVLSTFSHIPLQLEDGTIHAFGLSFGKIFFVSEDGVVFRIKFSWDEDEGAVGSHTPPAIFSVCLQYPNIWSDIDVEPPHFDEGSGRVVQCLLGKGVAVADTALSFL